MLTVLFAMTATLPGQLPVPTRPASLVATAGPPLAGLLATLEPNVARSPKVVTSNYQHWCINGYICFDEGPPVGQGPLIALPETARWRYICGCMSRLRSYQPWDRVYEERRALLMQLPGYSGSFVGYRLLESPNEYRKDYIAVIDGTPFETVRARSVKELEQKVVTRFAAYLERLDDVWPQLPRARTPSGGEGLLGGVLVEF